MNYPFVSECCDTVTISSSNSLFGSYNAFGIGKFTKSGTDGNGQKIYRNSEYNSLGLGDFILLFDGLGGSQSWIVSFNASNCNYQLI